MRDILIWIVALSLLLIPLAGSAYCLVLSILWNVWQLAVLAGFIELVHLAGFVWLAKCASDRLPPTREEQ